jgi:hypothetical protein
MSSSYTGTHRLLNPDIVTDDLYRSITAWLGVCFANTCVMDALGSAKISENTRGSEHHN